MDVCRLNHWKYLITFKEGSLPALRAEYQALREACPENRKSHRTPGGAGQAFAWVEQLEHVGDRKRRHRVNAFECREREEAAGADGQQTSFFAWLTNWPLGRGDTVAALANRGGRCRWKIENEGFNTQKNGGFNLGHAYGTGAWQIKNFYVLLQVAHLILQLLERGSLFTRDAKELFGSLRNLARRLGESLRNVPIPPDALDAVAAAAVQIRLNTS